MADLAVGGLTGLLSSIPLFGVFGDSSVDGSGLLGYRVPRSVDGSGVAGLLAQFV